MDEVLSWLCRAGGAIAEPKMFRLDYTTEIIRLLYGWPPYIFLFGELLGVEREVIEMEAFMPCLAIRHTLLQENAIIIPKNQS